jgi:general secretion pathway protein D
VLIKVLIAEVTHDKGSDLGAEFSILNLNDKGEPRLSVGTDFGVANSTGGLAVKIMGTEFSAALRALETSGKLDVLSRPYILASDNQLASIMVGQEVPYVASSRITDAGQTINTLMYQDVGILLDVTAHINPDGLVIMDVAPEISALTGTTVPVSDTVSVPVIARRAAQSRVAVKNGQTIVIGGLMEDRQTESVRKVPILGDIPVAGALFRRRQHEKIKTELLIFLTPHVASRPDALQDMSKDESRGSKLVPGSVYPGAFQEHMEGLQRGAMPSTQPAR